MRRDTPGSRALPSSRATTSTCAARRRRSRSRRTTSRSRRRSSPSRARGWRRALVTGLDTESAAAQVESVKAQVPTLQTQIVQGINAISLLLDEPPLGLSGELVGVRAIPPSPPAHPGRPAVRAGATPPRTSAWREAQLHAATANIGRRDRRVLSDRHAQRQPHAAGRSSHATSSRARRCNT